MCHADGDGDRITKCYSYCYEHAGSDPYGDQYSDAVLFTYSNPDRHARINRDSCSCYPYT